MFTLNCKGKLLVIDKPLVMGIINITPDSFYEGSRQQTGESILAKATKMINEGADIIDVGGQSTRPGSERITVKEELERVLPAIEIILKSFPGTIISVDTYQSQVAEACVNAGASMINDISAGNLDSNMIPAVAKLGVPYICMHMKGTPQTMISESQYTDVFEEVFQYFLKKVNSLKALGVLDIILDPGFGFAKTADQSFELLNKLDQFKLLELPILAGMSRKSMICKTLDTTPEFALNGTTAANTIALLKGAKILRVHDVKAAVEAIKIVNRTTRRG